MSKLQAALAWAARGFPVFPLVENDKTPAFGDSWPDYATTDPDTIRAYWLDPVLRTEHDYNIGMDCTDRVVIDIDVKKGKDGINEYAQMHGSYETLVVQTPTGGYHVYFEGPDSANIPLSSGIDIRSHRGYVVAPGSTIDGTPYVVVQDREPAWVPFNLEQRLFSPYVRGTGDRIDTVDNAANVDAAKRYLQSAEPAIEGQRGDEVTFQTAARCVRELGLSDEMTLELMALHWNDRCVPPWSLDELARKVENAVNYGTADIGKLDPNILFAAVPAVEPIPSVFEQLGTDFGNVMDPATIRPRNWLMDRLLMIGKTSIILATGSVGKSTIVLIIAAHLALGKDFGEYKTKRPCKSIIYNGEDDKEEMSRRLLAVCMSYNFDFNEVRKHVMLLSYEELDLRVMTVAGRLPVVNDLLINQIVELASNPEVGLLALDPFVDIHHGEETDSVQMNAVMRILSDIAHRAQIAILLAHHTSKSGSERQENRIGNMDIARGSSSIVNKCRVAMTLLDASDQDCEQYGLQKQERHRYVRMDDAKMNLTLRSDKATWFEKEGVRIVSGDVVGVLKMADLSNRSQALRIRIGEILIQTMIANNSGSMTVTQGIAVVKAQEPLWANHTDSQIKSKLEGMFAIAIEIRGQTVGIRRDTTDGKTERAYITLT